MYTKILLTITSLGFLTVLVLLINSQYIQPSHYAFYSNGNYIGNYAKLEECLIDEQIYKRMTTNAPDVRYAYDVKDTTCAWK